MGLFKTKKSSASTTVTSDTGSTALAPSPQRRLKKKFGFLKGKPAVPLAAALKDDAAEDTERVVAQVRAQLAMMKEDEQAQQRDSHQETLLGEDDLGDIPRSVSHQSRDAGEGLPRPPAATGDHAFADAGREGDDDSLGSPIDAMLRARQRANKDRAHELTEVLSQELAPTMEHLSYYIEALSVEISPDPSADLPSRALRCLFGLSEHASHKAERIAMVAHGAGEKARGMKDVKGQDEDGKESKDDKRERDGDAAAVKGPQALVPALLAFLRRCPRDSSEQYLALLVLNNLSIPTANKPIVARDCGGAAALGRLLCEDPGCHLLVIVLVNLTFGDDDLNRELLAGMCGGCVEEVQLVESLGYALLLSSLTMDQLAALGPIPLASPDGVPHAPRQLLNSLFVALEDKLGVRYRGMTTDLATLPLSMGHPDICPFPETARWCLSALKNLTRPGRLAPSIATGDVARRAHGAASAVAARAVFDAGLLPLLLRVLKEKGPGQDVGDSSGDGKAGLPYGWPANTAQDAGLYALLHMASVPWAREVLRVERGCVEVLVGILNYGRVIGESLKTAMVAINGEGGAGEEEEQLGRAGLQCLKARITLSYLVLGSENNADLSKYGAAITLSDHETLFFVDLLSNCIQGRAKEGPGGYSAATFTLKGVLYAIRCILSEPNNRKLFAASADGSRMNVLLLQAVARYSLKLEDVAEVLDAEAAEHAVVCLHWMTLYSLDESAVGFSNPLVCQRQVGGSVFLPSLFGESVGKKIKAKNVLAKILTAYLCRENTNPLGRHAATQILFRGNYLRFKGDVSELAYPGNACPTHFPFDMNEKLLAAIELVSGSELQPEGAKPKEYIFGRAISRKEKETGIGSKLFSSVKGATNVKTFPNALSAAEDLSAQQPAGSVDTVAVANNIAYYADGLDVYYGFFWKWDDGQGDSIERVYSAAETENEMLSKESVTVNESTERSEPYSPPRTGLLARLKIPSTLGDDSEPISIFGFTCGSPAVCTRRY